MKGFLTIILGVIIYLILCSGFVLEEYFEFEYLGTICIVLRAICYTIIAHNVLEWTKKVMK